VFDFEEAKKKINSNFLTKWITMMRKLQQKRKESRKAVILSGSYSGFWLFHGSFRISHHASAQKVIHFSAQVPEFLTQFRLKTDIQFILRQLF
jgi:hypothetical protein